MSLHHHNTSIRIALATGALAFGLAGSAHALPGKNSVDSNDIRAAAVNSSDIGNGQVKTPDLAFGSVTGNILGDGSVNSLKLLDNSVNSADVTDNALTSADVQDESLTGNDVKDDSLTGADVQESSLQGIMPAQTRFVVAETPPLSGLGGGTPGDITATCPAGERAIGGGGSWMISNFQDGNSPTALANAYLAASMPTPAQPGTNAATGWRATGRNVTGSDRSLRVYAICVPNQLP